MDNLLNSKFVKNLKHQAEENPVVVMLAVAAVMTAGAKLINAHGHSAGSRAYARQINAKLNKR